MPKKPVKSVKPETTKPVKYIGIVGSRRRSSRADFILLKNVFLEIYCQGDRIVSGGCHKGADKMAETLAKMYQIPILIHYAEWNRLGGAAGFVRNTDIARDCCILIAVVAKDRKGGTEDTIKKARALGKEIILL